MFGINFFHSTIFHRDIFPVGKTKPALERLSELLDSYLAPISSGNTALVLGKNLRGSFYHIVIPSSEEGIRRRIVKIASYLLVFPVIVALALKLILRTLLYKKYGKFSLQSDSDLLPLPHPGDLERIRDLHEKAYVLIEKHRSTGEPIQEESGISIIRDGLSFIYTSTEYPDLVFKSCPIAQAKHRYASFLIGSAIIKKENLNLLQLPKTRYETTSVKDRGLIIEERLPLKWVKNEFTEEEENKTYTNLNFNMFPAVTQLVTFISKTLYGKFYWKDLAFIDSEEFTPKIGLIDLTSISQIDCTGEESLKIFKRLALSWIERPDFCPRERLYVLGKAIYEMCPDEEILEAIKNKCDSQMDRFLFGFIERVNSLAEHRKMFV